MLDFVFINNEKLDMIQICEMGIFFFICFLRHQTFFIYLNGGNFHALFFIHFSVWLFSFAILFVLFVKRFFVWYELGIYERISESFLTSLYELLLCV